jgi:hypothetical protein
VHGKTLDCVLYHRSVFAFDQFLSFQLKFVLYHRSVFAFDQFLSFRLKFAPRIFCSRCSVLFFLILGADFINMHVVNRSSSPPIYTCSFFLKSKVFFNLRNIATFTSTSSSCFLGNYHVTKVASLRITRVQVRDAKYTIVSKRYINCVKEVT